MSDAQRVPAWRRLEALVLLGLAGVLRRAEPRRRARIGRRIGGLAWRLAGSRRRLAEDNVAAALGLPADEAAAVAREAFRHSGRILAECLAMPAYARPHERRLFDVRGLGHLAAAHAEGRGVIVFSAHYGNWELVAQQQALAGYPLDLIARPLDNPYLERRFRRWREQCGNRVLGKHGVLRRAVATLRAGRALAILIDQNATARPRLFVPFLGRPAATTPTLGRLAVRLGAPVVPVVSRPRDDGGYRIDYHPPLGAPSGLDDEARARWLTLEATRMIERWIREEPGCWMWMHDRWKSRPEPDETVEPAEESG
ncbi:MAG: hypothetical protein D6738_01640 [Acidobacteria bacterium]|nr:MAG: hypothetical protein D6738_01640 [Acidobacteriota bacterium]